MIALKIIQIIQVFLLRLNLLNDTFETTFSEIILNNIIYSIFSSKQFIKTVDLLNLLYPDNDNDLKLNKNGQESLVLFDEKFLSDNDIDEVDVLIFENLNELFFNNFLSSKIVSSQRNLKIGYFNHSTKLEIIWTIIPICIIGLIITPSFFLCMLLMKIWNLY